MNDKRIPKTIGYARVSTTGQELDLQLDALQKAGCSKKFIFVDKISGSKEARPGLDACLQLLSPGDTLLVWRLDRLGRSVRHLIDVVEKLRERGIGFKSLCDGAIDTTTASGELVFHIFTALAQFERRLVQERTRAGLSAARTRGRFGGRRPLDPKNLKVVTAKNLYFDRKMSISDICKTLGISRATFYRYIALQEGDGTNPLTLTPARGGE